MERRQFLGAAATLAGLADPTNEEPNDTEGQADAAANQPVPVFDPLLVDVNSHAFGEQYDEYGSIRVSSHPDPGEIVDAQIVIRGDWGEAGLGLTASEARMVGRELLEAAERRENRQ